MLFPANWYPYLTGWLYILKYTAAGVTAYYYLRRFTKGENGAVAGALMYAFSAFQSINLMFYHLLEQEQKKACVVPHTKRLRKMPNIQT